jgi:hypothetical protein
VFIEKLRCSPPKNAGKAIYLLLIPSSFRASLRIERSATSLNANVRLTLPAFLASSITTRDRFVRRRKIGDWARRPWCRGLCGRDTQTYRPVFELSLCRCPTFRTPQYTPSSSRGRRCWPPRAQTRDCSWHWRPPSARSLRDAQCCCSPSPPLAR